VSVADADVVQLQFSDDVDATTRARIEYAFRTFCAVYERAAEVGDDGQAQIKLHYGVNRGYRNRPLQERAPQPALVSLPPRPIYQRLRITHMPVFHSIGDGVDWLAEIFEWLSAADAYATDERDDVGRIPFSSSLHGRYGLDPTIPYASIAMLELACEIGLDPPQYGPTFVAATHDLDYIPTSRSGDLRRLVQNLGVAALVNRDPVLFASIAGAMLRGIVQGRSPLDCIGTMIEQERKRGIGSTSNVICRRTCRRDANYTLDEPAVVKVLRELHESGAELGVHASYLNIPDRSLGAEVAALRGLGYNVRGVRAHWLRYGTDDLFEAITEAKLEYDTTVGFANRVGFRNGASFIYRPYRFASESAYPFYEIPLAIMDGALYTDAHEHHVAAADLAARVLDMTDAFASGAISVLWHNTVFAGAQIPHAIGRLYWDLPRPIQRWTSAIEVLAARRDSYERAFRASSPAVAQGAPETARRE
jgi:hypothetical protein